MIQISAETQLFIHDHQMDDVRTLALQAQKYPHIDMPTAITQIAGRQVAAEKIPSWKEIDEIWYPKHLSLEQCSSEITARYKAKLIEGNSLADLTGGFGIDCSFLATKFSSVTYVERQKELCELAAHNFPILKLNHIHIANQDGVDYLQQMSPVDCIFIDPARRNEHGGKTVAISDCEPDVASLEDVLLNKAKRVMIKLSPMLDLSLALNELQYVEEIHVISANNECKELLLILGQTLINEPPIHCINLNTKKPQKDQCFIFTHTAEQQSECTYTKTLENYLYEPNASLLKAGAFRSIASKYKVKKLHANSHLYTSENLVSDFPGRAFRIINQCSLNKKELKEKLFGVDKANITVRNFPASVAELRKRIRLAEGGETYLFATTLYNEQKVLIRCEKI